MTKFKAVVAYIGTHYAGWQVQKGQRTVQGTLRDALHQITGETPSIVGAGRTDSGVHALGQVAHFRLSGLFSARKLLAALNGVLPPDIRLLKVTPVPAGFHAQRDALGKRYEYRIYDGPVLSPFQHGLVYHVRPRLDEREMERGARLLEGVHDFSGFAAAAGKVSNRVRQVYRSELRRKGHHLLYRIEGNGFLHHMVRNIMGTLLEIGKGRRSAGDIQRILESRDRRTAGPTAGAHGLYLVKVWYGPPGRIDRAESRGQTALDP